MKKFLALASLLMLGACTQQTSVDTGTRLADVVLTWQFESQEPADEFSAPQVQAMLVVTGGVEQTLDLGTYAGVEFTVPGNVSDLGESLTSASTWFAGGGDDLIVTREEEGDVVIMHRTVDEEAGFGTPEEVGRIDLNADATVTVTAENTSAELIDSDTRSALIEAFVAQAEVSAETIDVVIEQKSGNYIVGSVDLDTQEPPGGWLFIAVFSEEAWSVPEELQGNGLLECEDLCKHAVPTTLMSSCLTDDELEAYSAESCS